MLAPDRARLLEKRSRDGHDPRKRLRGWRLSFPSRLRISARPAPVARLASDVLGLFVRAVFASLRRRARSRWGAPRGQWGAVTFVQRFGSALNLSFALLREAGVKVRQVALDT